jgi:circadian clock protein KaiC
LDDVLGGGLPEYSFNLLAGSPGSGKTTLIHQLTFANASVERPALYFTVVGEPPLKMLRYQQQMAFFDAEKVGTAIRFVDLSKEVLTGDLALVLDHIVKHVQDANPAIVVVDSFRTVLRARPPGASRELELQEFLQKLALQLTSWQVTSFVLGEYGEAELHDNPVFTVADGLIWLSQHRERNSVVRKLEVVKMRGVASLPGLHTFRMSSQGVRVFPRAAALEQAPAKRVASSVRCRFGVAEIDEMLGGGLPAGDATLLAGPSGTGKTVLSTHFAAEGVKQGEHGVLAVFEEHPEDYLTRAESLGFDLRKMIEDGALRMIYLRRLDTSAEEILHQINEAVTEIDAKRLVIDSLNGVEIALAPTFREDFRESLYSLVARLTASGVSVLMTIEVMESFSEIRFSPHAISFLAQNILFLRYVEIDSRLRKMLAVVKMRRSQHSPELREFTVTSRGARLLGTFTDLEGTLTGVPRARAPHERPAMSGGLSMMEQLVLQRLRELDSASAAELADQTGLAVDEVNSALERLLTLNYALRATEATGTVFRALERSLGGGTQRS